MPFLDGVASELASEKPVEAIFSLRFCGASEALLAMEQSNPTVAVEIASLKPRFRRLIGEFVDQAIALGAVPHWGQLQYSYSAAQVAALFGQRLILWRRALAYIEELDPVATFSSAFSRARGLEWEGIVNSAVVPDYGLPLADESGRPDRGPSPALLNQSTITNVRRQLPSAWLRWSAWVQQPASLASPEHAGDQAQLVSRTQGWISTIVRVFCCTCWT